MDTINRTTENLFEKPALIEVRRVRACLGCGKSYSDSARFCSSCGQPIAQLRTVSFSWPGAKWFVDRLKSRLQRPSIKPLTLLTCLASIAMICICFLFGSMLLKNQVVSPSLAYQIESHTRKRTGSTASIEFSSGVSTERKSPQGENDAGKRTMFVDLPVDHPAYIALQPLLGLGIRFSDGESRLRAYDRVTWIDWQEKISQIYSLLELPDVSEAQSHSGRFMSNSDLNRSIAEICELLGVPTDRFLLWSGEKFYPGRLEAFSVLARVFDYLLSETETD